MINQHFLNSSQRSKFFIIVFYPSPFSVDTSSGEATVPQRSTTLRARGDLDNDGIQQDFSDEFVKNIGITARGVSI